MSDDREWRRAAACKAGHDEAALALLRRVERYLHATYCDQNAALLKDIRTHLHETTGYVIE